MGGPTSEIREIADGKINVYVRVVKLERERLQRLEMKIKKREKPLRLVAIKSGHCDHGLAWLSAS